MTHRVAIVGAGPSGFYAADGLLRGRPDLRIDLIDRLPTPFGLVRSGVAPDHQGTKAVARQFERLLGQPDVRFAGNVEIGRDSPRRPDREAIAPWAVRRSARRRRSACRRADTSSRRS
jgi:ferredoxin--NADP+ reductase